MCISVLPVCVCDAVEDKKWVPGPLELELEIVVNHFVGSGI